MTLYSRCKDCGEEIKFRTTRCDECKLKLNRSNRYKDMNDDIRKIYQTSKWRKCRDLVKQRDNYLCQLSLLEDKLIAGDTVHHIEALRPNTLCLAYDLNNLILLSKDKHDELHKLGIDTKEKFINYIKKVGGLYKFAEIVETEQR